MKRYISYFTVIFTMFFASCMNLTEGLDESEVLVVSVKNVEMDHNGGEVSIDVNSYCSWDVVSTEEWSWIKATTTKGNKGKSNFKIILDENETIEDRVAVVTVGNDKYGLLHDITILQKAGSPFINISKDIISATEDGVTESIVVESNVDYTISSSKDWCALSIVKGESGDMTLDVEIAPNPTLLERKAIITIKNEQKDIVKEIVVNQGLFTPSLEVSQNNISSTEEGRDIDFTVTSNISWTADCDADWVTVTPSNGTKGVNTVKVLLDRNSTAEVRTANIVVSNSEYQITKEIEVKQLAFGPGLEISDSQIDAPCEAMTKDITVTSNIQWTASCEANWVVLTPANGDGGAHVMTITLKRNSTTSSREATVVISNNEYGLTREVAVSQEAFVPELIVSDSQISATAEGLEKQITITSNIEWNAVCQENWVTLSAANGTGSDKTFTVTIANNSTTSVRNGTITISNAEYDLSCQILVGQNAFAPRLNVSVQSLSFSNLSEARNISVDANVEWSASCNADWLTVSPVNGNGSDGIKTVTVSAASNMDMMPRTATIIIQNSSHNLSKSIVVTQAEFSPEISIIGESALTVDYMSGTSNVVVNSNVQYVAATDVNWMRVEQTMDGIRLLYTTNYDPTARTAEVVISATEISDLECVLTVTQAGYDADNTIRYTSNGGVIMLGTKTGFGATIVSVTCEGGEGSIMFDGPVTSIPSGAFSNCTELTGIAIPASVTQIGSEAFLGCSNLATITFDGEVASIGTNAFKNCTSLVDIELPSTLTAIATATFSGCTSLESVTIPSGVTSIGSNAFSYCSKLESINIPSSVTEVGSYAFAYCSFLKNVTLPTGLTSIADHTFYNCTKLANITIPAQVTSIGRYAFSNCSSLKVVIIPAVVASIGDYAFAYCTTLNSVVVQRETPASGATSMFSSNAASRKIYVPIGCSGAYKSASYWSSYSSSIYDIEYTPTECTSLTITAEDVEASATSTIITYTAITNGTTPFGELTDIQVTGRVQSESFDANETEEDVEVTISFSYLGVNASTTIIQRAKKNRYYTVNLNNQWRQSSKSNPNSTLYEGVYESYSNYNVNNSTATMYIDIVGYEKFELYIRSFAETKYDYVTVSELDSTSVKASTSNNQNSGTSLSSYTKVTYSGIDKGSHRITIVYRKDTSQHTNDDRGYILIPKNQ